MQTNESIQDVPPAPRKATPLARKLIYRFQGSQRVTLIIGVSFLLFGMIFPPVFMWNMPLDWLLDLYHRPGRGIVTEVIVVDYISQDDLHPHKLIYQYNADDTAYTSFSYAYDISEVSDYPVGSHVDLEVLPWNPAVSRIGGMHLAAFSYWVCFVLIFPLLGLLLVIFAFRSNTREIRAYRSGVPAAGKITKTDYDASTTINGRHPFVIHWKFEVDGKTFKGSLSHMDDSVLIPLARDAEGHNKQQVIILYLEKDPHINVMYF